MIYVQLAAVIFPSVIAFSLVMQVRRDRREHARERQAWTVERGNLLDRIMLLAEKPWTLPPTPDRPSVDAGERVEAVEDIEQYPAGEYV